MSAIFAVTEMQSQEIRVGDTLFNVTDSYLFIYDWNALRRNRKEINIFCIFDLSSKLIEK